MTQYLSMMTCTVLGPGHAMEDTNPIPTVFRTGKVQGSQPVEPVKADMPIDSVTDKDPFTTS